MFREAGSYFGGTKLLLHLKPTHLSDRCTRSKEEEGDEDEDDDDDDEDDDEDDDDEEGEGEGEGEDKEGSSGESLDGMDALSGSS